MRNRKFQKKITKKLKNTVVALFQAKIRCKKAMKERKQKLSFHSIPIRRVIENSKKIAKKFKKLKDTIMASFQAFWSEKSKKEGK